MNCLVVCFQVMTDIVFIVRMVVIWLSIVSVMGYVAGTTRLLFLFTIILLKKYDRSKVIVPANTCITDISFIVKWFCLSNVCVTWPEPQ